MTTYAIMRGRLLVSVEPTLARAVDRRASEAGTRIIARHGLHPRWHDRLWWAAL